MTTSARARASMTGDTAWNYGAFAVTAGVGAAVTFLIGGRMDAGALGVFAQLYAVHVIAGQVAVFGVHDSTQRHVASEGAPDGDAPILAGALAATLPAAVAVAGLIALAARTAGTLVGSPDVGQGLYLVAPGVAAFALNKVLFGAINGRGQLRTYARMQLLRAALVLTAALLLVGPGAPAFVVGGIFAGAELVLLPCLLVVARPHAPRETRAAVGAWVRRHLTFGGRGLVNGILLETHLRVDVLTLSFFVSDRDIGIYAFAVLFAEGLYQVAVVIRTVAYPTLVRLASRGDRDGLAAMARRLAWLSGGVSAAVAVLIFVGYPVVARLIDPAFVGAGATVLPVLLAGMTLYAFVVPFDQLLLQSGYPGRQSGLMTAYVVVNVVLNLLLIPRLGLVGAALATAVALCGGAALLLVASWRWLGYRGGVLFHRAQVI